MHDIASKARTMVDVLRARADEAGPATAYVYLRDGDDHEATLSYAALDASARAIGAELQARDHAVRPVLLVFPPGLGFLRAFYGCLYAGAIAVPTNVPNPAKLCDEGSRLRAIVRDCRPLIALTEREYLERLDPRLAQDPDLRAIQWLAIEDIASDAGGGWRDAWIAENTLAFLQYTSGSTAAPRGVRVSHGNILAAERIIATACDHTAASTFVGWLPVYHDMGMIGNILQPMFLGARSILMAPTSFLQKPSRWLRAVSKYGARTSGGPNFAYDLCTRRVSDEQKADLDLSRWEIAFNGAEPVRKATCDAFAEAFAGCGFRREAFYPCYGLAEATLMISGSRRDRGVVWRNVDATALQAHRVVEARPDAPQAGVRTLVGCGRAVLDTRIAIVDPETQVPCATGEVGEIWVSGETVARGYWNRPDESAGVFHASLRAREPGAFLRTGDLGFLDGDELFVTGRLKDLVIIRGQNYYPQDIELSAEHASAALRRGCGAAFSIDTADGEALALIYEVERGVDMDFASIASAVRDAIARDHALPLHDLAFVRAGLVPKTTSGKVQRRLCRAALLDAAFAPLHRSTMSQTDEDRGAEVTPAPDGPTPASTGTAEGLDAWLRAQIGRLTRRDPASISEHGALVAEGVDSLAAIEIAHTIDAALHVDIPFVRLLEGWSFRQLASAVRDGLPHASVAEPQSGRDDTTAVTADAPAEFPLSHGQQALWSLHQLSPASSAYIISRAFRTRAPLDLDRLQQAWQAMATRHPILRTVFVTRDGTTLQRVLAADATAGHVTETDAVAWTDATLSTRLAAESSQPFDLAHAPQWRVRLFRRDGHDVLLLALHHIITDFWSLGLMLRELGDLYAIDPRDPIARHAAAPPRATYADFVRQQRALLDSPAADALWRYWDETLAGDLEELDLRLPPPSTAAASPADTDTLQFSIAPALTDALKELCARHESTLCATMLAAFQALLHRYAGQRRILVGTPAAGRGRPELAQVCGYFVNPVIVPADFGDDPTFADLLARTKAGLLSALAHQDLPFSLLVERRQPRRAGNRPPIFQVLFVWQKTSAAGDAAAEAMAVGAAGADITVGPLALRILPLPAQDSHLDLTLMLAEREGRIDATLRWQPERFDAASMSRLIGHFTQLLSSIAAAPATRTSQLSIVPGDERDRLEAYSRGRTATWSAREETVMAAFERTARRHPSRIAVACHDERVRYDEVNAAANRLARHLVAHGAGPESIVALFLDRSPSLIVALLAVLKTGAAYAPLDPRDPPARTARALADLTPVVVLTDNGSRAALPAWRGTTICLDDPGTAAAITASGESNLGVAVSPSQLAYLIFTSGSTGTPKAVGVTHGGLFNYAHALLSTLDAPVDASGDPDTPWQFGTVSTIAADLGNTCIFPPLVAGGTVALISTTVANDAHALAAYVETHGLDVLKIVPSHLTALLGSTDAAARLLPSRWLVLGGEASSVALLARLRALQSPCHIVNHYGPTETTVGTLVHRVPDSPMNAGERTVPLGRPLANSRVYLVDRRDGTCLAPMGAVGELCIGGVSVARGYVGRPAQTAERFVPDPFAAGARMYRTGDVGRYLADGSIEFLGREDAQVKIRGFRVELGEVDAALRRHPAIREAAVTLRHDEASGPRLAGFYVVGGGHDLDVDTVRGFLAEHLPAHMIPATLMQLAAIPLTPNGKVDVARLPHDDTSSARAHSRAPSTPLEELLAAFYEEALGGRDAVGMDDDFFALGGHSLQAITLLTRVQDFFGTEATLTSSFFRRPSIAGLADALLHGPRAGEHLRAASALMARLDTLSDPEIESLAKRAHA